MHAHLDFNGLVSNAHVVITATCTDVRVNSDPVNSGVVGSMARFDEVQIIRENKAGTAPRSRELELHYLGGSDGETHLHVCGTPSFKPGSRYLLFLFNDGTRYISPIVGGTQGLFVIRNTADGRLAYAVNAEGHSVLGVEGSNLLLSPCVVQEGTHAEVHCDHRNEDHLNTNRTENDSAYHDSPMPFSELIRAIQAHHFDRPSLEELIGNYDDLPVLVRAMSDNEPIDEYEIDGVVDRGLGACNYQNVYISIKKNDNVPGFANWAVLDQYARDVYDVHMNIFTNTPGFSNGTWDAGNNVSEIIGFPSSSILAANYVIDGIGYTWSPSTLAVCFTYTVSTSPCSRIKEADIAFNPAYSWTTDWNNAFQTNAVNYRSVVLHEIGHAWGYQTDTQYYPETYNYGQPSVMHKYYFGQIWEDGKEIHSKDAQVIRSLYDNQTSIKDVDDLGIESYRAVSGSGLVNGYVNHPSVASGETMRVYNVTVENNSNVSQSGVRIRFYLSTNRSLGSSDHLVGNYSLGTMSAVTRIVDSYLLDMDGVPPGTYFIGMKVSRGGTAYNDDDRPANDVTWSTYSVQVTPSVGVDEIAATVPLTVYPNPTNGLLQVDIPQVMTDGIATVVDPTGRLLIQQVYTASGTAPLTLDLSALAAGSYVVMLCDQTGLRRVSRIVRQ